METKPASKRQMAYIRRLQTVMGENEPEICAVITPLGNPRDMKISVFF